MSDREKFESWFDKEYLGNEDRRKNYRLSTVKELMLASWNAALAQPSGEAQEGRITELEGAVTMAIECFDAAEAEGLSGEINSSELQSTLAGQRIYDIYHRRIIFAIDALKGGHHG